MHKILASGLLNDLWIFAQLAQEEALIISAISRLGRLGTRLGQDATRPSMSILNIGTRIALQAHRLIHIKGDIIAHAILRKGIFDRPKCHLALHHWVCGEACHTLLDDGEHIGRSRHITQARAHLATITKAHRTIGQVGHPPS